MNFDSKNLRALRQGVMSLARTKLAQNLDPAEFDKVRFVETPEGVTIKSDDSALEKKARELLGFPPSEPEETEPELPTEKPKTD